MKIKCLFTVGSYPSEWTAGIDLQSMTGERNSTLRAPCVYVYSINIFFRCKLVTVAAAAAGPPPPTLLAWRNVFVTF